MARPSGAALGNRCRSLWSILHAMDSLEASGLLLRTSGARPAVSVGLSSSLFTAAYMHVCSGAGPRLWFFVEVGAAVLRLREQLRPTRPIITEGLPGHERSPKSHLSHISDPVTLVLQMRADEYARLHVDRCEERATLVRMAMLAYKESRSLDSGRGFIP